MEGTERLGQQAPVVMVETSAGRIATGAWFRCNVCGKVRPAVTVDGVRQFTGDDTHASRRAYWRRDLRDCKALGVDPKEAGVEAPRTPLWCLDCRAEWLLRDMRETGAKRLVVLADGRGVPALVGDWGGRLRWPVIGAESYWKEWRGRPPVLMWRFTFSVDAGDLWAGGWRVAVTEKEKQWTPFARCKRITTG